MQIPFISFGNEDIIYDLDYRPYFVSAIEIIIYRYLYFFKNNKVEKMICFAKDEKVTLEEIINNLKTLNFKDTEIFLDCSSLDNKLFMHITHVDKIKEEDLTILENYLKSFDASIYNIKVNLDKYCPFAISFSFNYNPRLIKELNVKRYKSLLN